MYQAHGNRKRGINIACIYVACAYELRMHEKNIDPV
jgi:hypothetical protein